MQHRHVDNLHEWAQARVTNASLPGWAASVSDHAVMSTQTPAASLAEDSSVVLVVRTYVCRGTLVPNHYTDHHTDHRNFWLLVALRTSSHSVGECIGHFPLLMGGIPYAGQPSSSSFQLF